MLADMSLNLNHNFIVPVVDTDSLTICKQDGGEFTKQELDSLTIELNSLFPPGIRWEFEFYIPKLIVLKAKNYILFDGDKVKLKGSSLRDQKKEPALKEMTSKMIDCLVYDHPSDAINVYKHYIKEAMAPTDIRRWAAKKSISKSIMKCKGYTEEDILEKRLRRNETVVWDAVCHTPLQEGDKVYLYPAILSTTIETKTLKNGTVKEKVIKNTGLKLADEWSGDHDSEKLIERVYNTAEILGGVLDMSEFVDYTLSKNKYLLDTL